MKDFSGLKRNLKRDFGGLKNIRVAILGDSSTQFLNQAIRGEGFDSGFDLEMWEADFDQVELQVFDDASELYQFNPEVIILFNCSHKLLAKYNKRNQDSYSHLASDEIELIKNISEKIRSRSDAKLIYYNYTEIDDSVFGNYASRTEISFLFQLRKLNYELMLYAATTPDFFICDISTIQNITGKSNFFRPSIYINSEMVISLDALPLVAAKTVNLIAAMNGRMVKCVILDLDNTMWGGIIGDDGMEGIQIGNLGIGKAFTEFQLWLKKLKNRGIILAVCSKNTESIAMEPFLHHPDMVLHADDITVFMANWESKVDNIRSIQEILNIGFDSMVFLDDNPFERNVVREHIPQICIPELPEDPAEYLEFLYSLNLFETLAFSKEDAERTQLYQTEAKRVTLQKKFTNEDDFLQTLNMTSEVQPFNKFNTPRVAQLTQRSNQFNLRTIRYTESEIENLLNSDNYFNFAFTLKDKFGDNGLICVIILFKKSNTTLFIDTWLMSCRVLRRGMENFVLNKLVSFAQNHGFSELVGEYIVTQKNGMVKDHYLNLGFESSDKLWKLNCKDYKYRPTFIEEVYENAH